jgi:hypothetical protein
MNPYDTPEYVRPGMSGTAKWLLGLGIGCGVVVLLCCGVFGGGAFWMVRTAQRSISEDPATIRRLTDEIVTIDIPESLPPRTCMDFNIPFWNTKVMTWVAYGEESGGNGLFLAQFGQGLVDEDSMTTQWRESMRQSGQRDWDDVEIEQTENHEVEINGSATTFRVAKGHESKSKEEVWQLTGSFQGKGGPALMVLKLHGSQFTKQQVLAILDSMK